MSGNLVLPNLEGNPSCSDVEPKWANILKNGFSTPSQVVLDELVLAELRFGRVFLGDTLLPYVGEVLVKNPYDDVSKRLCGVRNGIAKLQNNLLVVVSEIGGVEDGWQVRRVVNWDNLNHPADMFLLKNSFTSFLNPFGSKPSEV